MAAMADRAARDRDPAGRPKNARPRDALGRPMPRDAEAVYTEEELPDDPDELLRIGIEHFNARRFFQAHEAWETAWHPSPDAERDFWQGITQIAVGFTHYQRGNPKGSVSLLRKGAHRLDAYGESFHGVPVAALARAARKAADAVERAGTTAPIEFPTIRVS
jgi:predicted metal-dependent hydrolase